MKKLKETKKPNPYARKTVVPFKVNDEELRAIQSLAKQFSEGNISEWVRYAALNFKPQKSDLEK